MSFEQWIALASVLIALYGVPKGLLQWRDAIRQRRRESLNKVFDVNRELISMGFAHPELFDILIDKPVSNAEFERRYLQLWLNQMSMIHANLNDGGYDADAREGLERNIADMMTRRNMQRHWQREAEVYSPSFQDLVNSILSGLDTGKETPS